MNKVANLVSAILAGMILLSSCHDKGTESPYDEILQKGPFKTLTDSIRLEPNNHDLYFRRAVLLNSNNFPEPALLDFQKAWSLKKEEKYALGVSTLLLEKKPDSAILFLDDARKLLPGSQLLQLTLARAYDSKGNMDSALDICNEVLGKNPSQVDVMKMKADLLLKKGNSAEAISILEQAYRLTPYDPELNHLLAFQLAETKNPKVVPLCDSLIQADSSGQHAEPYYYKGIYYSNIDNKAQALVLFDEAIKRDYTFLESYTEKGSILYDQKKYNEAIKVFNLSLNVSPDYPDNYYWIAKCQEAMGQKEEALLNYQRAYGLNKDFREAKEGADRLAK